MITGATAGFGESCAIRFANEGWKTILVGRRQDRLDRLKTQLSSMMPVHSICLDVRDQKRVLENIDQLPEPFKEIDVLINNAGLALGLGGVHDADVEDWETMIDTNIKGLLYVTRAVLPAMVARQSGHIINLGSVAGSWPYPGGNVYGATKAFVKQLSNNMRSDLLGTQVRVTNIEPGMAETEFSMVRFKGDAGKAQKVYTNAKPLTADDISEIIYWAATRPAHVNINSVEVMPTCQALGPYAIHRKQ
jgi:3-hydroxy acid dehydrogenase/malonic semialdehyde reductase